MSVRLLGVPAYTVPSVTSQAVRFSASGNHYSRLTDGITSSVDLTVACWVKLVVNRATYSMAWASGGAAGRYTQFGTNGGGVRYSLSSTAGGGNTTNDFTVGTWYYIAFTLDKVGALDSMWLGTTTTLTNVSTIFTHPTGLNTADTMYIGTDSFSNWLNGSIACMRIWLAPLTQAQLEAEMVKRSAQRTANLWASYELNGLSTTDSSGNGRTLTQTGTPTVDTSGPPVT